MTLPPRDAAAFIEPVSTDAAQAHIAAWRRLCVRASEPNVFAEPEFVLPALRCIGATRRLQMLLVWRDDARQALIGVAVLRFPVAGFGVARIWQSEQAGLPALMLDREAIAPALDAIVDWLARQPRLVGLVAPTLEAEGPTAAALGALAARANLAIHWPHKRARAALPATSAPLGGIDSSLPKKRVKEWARQRRRLAEGGALAYTASTDARGVEEFLALEARGWKGARGTALRDDPALARFTRAMLEGFAAEGRLTIHRLARDGAPIAIGLVLRAQRRAFYWKTAYDEAFAAFSPGVQLTLDLSRAVERDASIALTDSCAIPDHPMIDSLWTARLALVDCVIATRPGAAAPLALWLRGEALRLRLREAAKTLVNRLRA